MFALFVMFNCILPTLSFLPCKTRNEVVPSCSLIWSDINMCFPSVLYLLQKYTNTEEIICQLKFLKRRKCKKCIKGDKIYSHVACKRCSINCISFRGYLLFWHLLVKKESECTIILIAVLRSWVCFLFVYSFSVFWTKRGF